MARIIRIATCQFPVGSSVSKNHNYIKKQIIEAANERAILVHFSECCLSGYGGFDFKKYTREQQIQIETALIEIQKLANKCSVWVVVGTHFFEKNLKKPGNSLFVINSEGQIKLRYNKRMLAEIDLEWYASGKETGIFDINGIKCGLLICHEWRYPELYRQYYKMGVEVLFQSWYDGNYSEEGYQNEGKNLGEVIPGYVRGNAANNKFWISCANTSKKQSSFPAFVCRPDGAVAGKLKRNVTGVLVTEIDVDELLLDPSGHMRDSVLKMKL